jgi:hypothetical protein
VCSSCGNSHNQHPQIQITERIRLDSPYLRASNKVPSLLDGSKLSENLTEPYLPILIDIMNPISSIVKHAKEFRRSKDWTHDLGRTRFTRLTELNASFKLPSIDIEVGLKKAIESERETAIPMRPPIAGVVRQQDVRATEK